MSFTRQCAVPVHPRLRGELATDTVSVTVTGGSSPLTRGTQQETFGARQRPRFIPAYAGNSNSLISFEVNMTVHPRLRGELHRDTHCNKCYFGSSPLTRGTPAHPMDITELIRFIPAYAGNSINAWADFNAAPVHPRLRGELKKRTRPRIQIDGSSPLTRGTPLTRLQLPGSNRFIPAYAGNSQC